MQNLSTLFFIVFFFNVMNPLKGYFVDGSTVAYSLYS